MPLAAAELTLCCALLVLTTQAMKYHDVTLPTSERSWGWDDLGIGIILGSIAFLMLWIHPYAYALATAFLFVLFFVLWLDALMYRIFTIELGVDGVGGVVVLLLFVELAGLARVRRFFVENLSFAVFPVLVAIVFAQILFAPGSLARMTVGAFLTFYFAVVHCGCRKPALKPRPASMSLRYVFQSRPFPNSSRIDLLDEHTTLIEDKIRSPRRSPRHGSLHGMNVVMLSFESAGREHAKTPWLTGLASRSVRSKNHFCVSPTTNNAHACLYPERSLSPLRDEGYQTVYLTTVETKHFGLRPLLDRAGFDHVFDASVLEPHALDGGKISDYALLTNAKSLLDRLPNDKPKFIHVHASNTHVPYRVVDGDRFARHDSSSDMGRFLNGVEETDFIFSEFLREIASGDTVREPLVVVTSDHGQSFGESGYYSHGSAVTREQLMVPFLLHHPTLDPGEIEYSSHHDVMPTILDLLGLSAIESRGESVFLADRPVQLLVCAGHPSRSTTTNFGLILGHRKFMVDLIRDRCYRSDWHDEAVDELYGVEKEYYCALLSRMMVGRGIV